MSRNDVELRDKHRDTESDFGINISKASRSSPLRYVRCHYYRMIIISRRDGGNTISLDVRSDHVKDK